MNTEIKVETEKSNNKKELRVADITVVKFTSGGTNPIYMKLLHKPTGIVVEGKAFSRFRLARNLELELKQKIAEYSGEWKTETT